MVDADMEMITANRRLPSPTIFAGFGDEDDGLPVLPPIVAHEMTASGWRGLTAHGEVFEVRGGLVPTDDFIEMRDGQAVGRRAITTERNLDISRYLEHYNRAIECFRDGRCNDAVAEIDAAIALVPTLRARFNRALMLLGAGRWREGFAQYEDRVELGAPFPKPPAGIKRWLGEPLAGKRIVLQHEQGFGDTIMALRYVAALKAMGADVVLDVPHELARLAERIAPVCSAADAGSSGGAEFYLPMMSLLHLLDPELEHVPPPPYLALQCAASPSAGRRKIGVAWSVGREVDGDFPRAIPLRLLVEALKGADLYSIQTQGAEEANAIGVKAFPIFDFAECAYLISRMDEIIAVDTAALHVAGATGHPNVTALLSHWCSWRWRGNLFYPAIKLCRQASPGDWASALAQI